MISDAAIKAALKAVTTELTLRDKSNGRGAGSLLLVVRRLSGGATSAQWFAMTKRDGKRTKRQIGRYPEMSLAMARQHMAAEVSPALLSGKALTAACSERPTVAGLFRAFVAHLADAGRSPDYVAEVERMLLTAKSGAAADAFGPDTAPADVTPADLAEYVRGFIRRGSRGGGDKARAYVSAAFGWAVKAAHDPTVEAPVDWGVDRNPAEAVRRDEKARRTIDRTLAADEIRQLWKATAPDAGGFSPEVAAAIRLVLCCGQRIQETLRLEGADVDLDAATWTMPAHKTKGRKRSHAIPLTSQAVAELRRLVGQYGSGALFPARGGSKGETIDHRSVRQAIDRWLALEGVDVPKFTPRDLRRTWKSRAGDGANISKEVRDLIQQHAKHDTGSKSYDRADYLPQMREAMTRWEAWLDQVLTEKAQEETRTV